MKKDFYYLSPFVLIPVWVFFINLVDKWDLSIIPYIFIGGSLVLSALIGGFTPIHNKVDLRITFFVPLAFFITIFIGGFFDTGTCSGEPRLDFGEAFRISKQPWFLLVYILMAVVAFLASFLKIRILRRRKNMTSNTQPYPFVPSIFDKMWQTSESLLKDISTTKMTQAVVLLSSKGKEYSTIIEDVLAEEKNAEKSLVSELRANDDTEICYILAVWKNGCVDVPSYDFRKMLCRLNIENKNAAIFLMGEAGYHTKPLRVTMANFDFLNEEDDIL